MIIGERGWKTKVRGCGSSKVTGGINQCTAVQCSVAKCTKFFLPSSHLTPKTIINGDSMTYKSVKCTFRNQKCRRKYCPTNFTTEAHLNCINLIMLWTGKVEEWDNDRRLPNSCLSGRRIWGGLRMKEVKPCQRNLLQKCFPELWRWLRGSTLWCSPCTRMNWQSSLSRYTTNHYGR